MTYYFTNTISLAQFVNDRLKALADGSLSTMTITRGKSEDFFVETAISASSESTEPGSTQSQSLKQQQLI